MIAAYGSGALEEFHEFLGAFFRDRDEQTSGGLCVRQDQARGFVFISEVDPILQIFKVPPGSAGDMASGDQLGHLGQDRDVFGHDLRGHAGLKEQVAEVTQKPEPGHVGSRPDPDALHRGCRFTIEGRHTLHRCRASRRGGRLGFDRSGHDPGAEGLGENQQVTSLCCGVGHEILDVDLTDRHQPILGFGVVHGVSSHDGHTGFACDVGSSANDVLGQPVV